MNEDGVVTRVVEGLERLGIEYMIVGSYASNAWGRPRGSYDADIVIKAGESDAGRILGEFEADFVIEPEAMTADLRDGRMFNLVPKSGAFKVDLIPLRKTDFAREEFSRRRQITALGRTVSVASPEDTILFKLAWHRMGHQVSERQIEDARDIYARQKAKLDEAYLNRWAERLGVPAELARIRT